MPEHARVLDRTLPSKRSPFICGCWGCDVTPIVPCPAWTICTLSPICTPFSSSHGVEPLPEDSPFWSLPNVIVTPHNGVTTPATQHRGVEILADNLRRYMAGEPLRNVVDKPAGY
jgi:hypothetical protein